MGGGNAHALINAHRRKTVSNLNYLINENVVNHLYIIDVLENYYAAPYNSTLCFYVIIMHTCRQALSGSRVLYVNSVKTRWTQPRITHSDFRDFRRRFPNVKRVQSNHVYYYAGIRRVNNVENLPQTSMITEGILLLIYHNRILTLIF